MKAHTGRRAIRAAAVLATGAVVALGASTAALAADPTADPTTIDSTKSGTLVIHKYEQPETATGLPNNGTVQDPVGLAPIENVEFSIVQVPGYDLTTNGGWTDLASLTVEEAQSATAGITGTPVTTKEDGTATAADLPLGVYLVTETKYPVGAMPAAPFLVTLPATDPVKLDNWMYVVHVYPKNSFSRVTKTVEDSGAYAIGDTVTWTILGDIPNYDVIDGYKIVDPLDERLEYVSTAVSLVDEHGNPLTGVTLVENDDYTVTVESTPAPTTTTVTVLFSETGRKILAANHEAQVKVVITTTVIGNGDIENTAYLYPNEASFDVEPGQPGGPTPSDPEDTYFGNVTIKKVGPDPEHKSTMVPLKDATFQVYSSEAAAKAGTEPLSVDGVSSWTTDSNGVLTIEGLRQSAWYNGEEVSEDDDNYQYYWVVETKAPSGYSLLAAPVKVSVGDVDTVIDITIEDALHNGGFPLPMTGGVVSTALFYGAGGAILLSLAIVLVARSRRKDGVTAE